MRTLTPTRTLSRALALALSGLVAAAAGGAALERAGVRVLAAPRPYDALPATLATALGLLAYNARVALWPLALVALGWPRVRAVRWLGDALAAGQLLGHGAVIGGALAQQPALWRYLPHLPLESTAIALPVAAWLTARRTAARPRARALAAIAAIVTALLALAAIVETYLVPL